MDTQFCILYLVLTLIGSSVLLTSCQTTEEAMSHGGMDHGMDDPSDMDQGNMTDHDSHGNMTHGDHVDHGNMTDNDMGHGNMTDSDMGGDHSDTGGSHGHTNGGNGDTDGGHGDTGGDHGDTGGGNGDTGGGHGDTGGDHGDTGGGHGDTGGGHGDTGGTHGQADGTGAHSTGHSVFFWLGHDVQLIFEEWTTDSDKSLGLAVLYIVLTGIVFEGLKALRHYISGVEAQYSKEAREWSYSMSGKKSGSSCSCCLVFLHISQALLHAILVFIGMCLMLAFMTFNVWLCVAVCGGAGLGYLIFGKCHQRKYNTTELCH